MSAPAIDVAAVVETTGLANDTSAALVDDGAVRPSSRSRIRRRATGSKTSRRSVFARFIRATLADGLAVAEGRVRPRRSNEDQT
jgi:hypothetical protein